MVYFDKGWIGFKNAVEFEKLFEVGRYSKKEWSVNKGSFGFSIYGWFVCVDDYYLEGKIGDYFR